MTSGKPVKALALLSGGLDSALAIRLVLIQGVDVTAVNFILPFVSQKKDYAGCLAKELGIPLVRIEADEGYIHLIRNPKYGYGSNMNPCIDCHIYMLRQAKKVAQEIGADFIVTGDVLGERPMSQNKNALRLEEKEAGLDGLILRPLSAKLLPETIPEHEGWIDRQNLLALKGKGRRFQLELALKFGITDYNSPAGGCLLTNKEFATKLKRLFALKEDVTKRDIELLKIGRHFYSASSEIIVGRNERENKLLLELREPEDYIFQVPDFPSPITLLRGNKDKDSISYAAKLTARYSDANTTCVSVEYRNDKDIMGKTPVDLQLPPQPETDPGLELMR